MVMFTRFHGTRSWLVVGVSGNEPGYNPSPSLADTSLTFMQEGLLGVSQH